VASVSLSLEQLLRAAAVLDQVGDRTDLEAVLACEHDEIRQPRHRPVVLHDLAQHRRCREAGKAHEIAACLGVAGARQHAARLRDERKDMPRLHDVLGQRMRRRGHADRMRTICRRDAGAHAVRRLDRHREIGAVNGAVDEGHRRQVEHPRALFGDRHADQSAAVLCHEVDRFRRNAIGGDDEIAFVLAILFVDEDHHSAVAKIGDDVLDRGNRHGSGPRFRCVIFHLTGTCIPVIHENSDHVVRVRALSGSA
jgi:hypothetical protein